MGLVDLILGAITILCFINAIVSMVYIYLQAKQKYGKVEKYTSNKKMISAKGKVQKESASSQHLRTQKHMEQLAKI